MEKLNTNLDRLRLSLTNFSWFKTYTFTKGIILLAVIISVSGCKKNDDNKDREYGYAKLTVNCAKKCHINYYKTSTPDMVNDFDVEASQAVYYIRYQRQYSITLNVTPIDEDQDIRLNVYSRETKQIYQNVAKRKANVVWSSTVIIP